MYKAFSKLQQNSKDKQGVLVPCEMCESIKYNITLHITIKEVNGNR